MSKEKAINYWFNMADYDLKTAQVMLDGGRYLYVGFMCHQVIEKALKGLYVKQHNRIPPYTHNLLTLCADLNLVLTEEHQDFFIINPAIIVVILNPSHVILSAAKNLVVMLRTGSGKDLVTA